MLKLCLDQGRKILIEKIRIRKYVKGKLKKMQTCLIVTDFYQKNQLLR